MDPHSRKRLRIALITIILASLPCYCTGLVMVRLEQIQAGNLTSTATASQTLQPTLTRIPSLTLPPSLTASSTGAGLTHTPTVTASSTLLPTSTATNTSPPSPTPTATDTPTPTPTSTTIPSALPSETQAQFSPTPEPGVTETFQPG